MFPDVPQTTEAEPDRTEPDRTEPGRSEPGRTEPGRTEPVRSYSHRGHRGHQARFALVGGSTCRPRCFRERVGLQVLGWVPLLAALSACYRRLAKLSPVPSPGSVRFTGCINCRLRDVGKLRVISRQGSFALLDVASFG